MRDRCRDKIRRKSAPVPRAPELAVAQILAWADAWHNSCGAWPTKDSGSIPYSLGQKWHNVDMALRRGNRGLNKGSSLARLLAERRGVRNRMALPPFKVRTILDWCDMHHQETGRWPRASDGSISQAPGESWEAVDSALRAGARGLLGGSSLAQLLAEQRGVRNEQRLPALRVQQILLWADEHRQRTGRWPRQRSGPIGAAPGETWEAVHMALSQGGRGLPGGSSLAQLLAAERGVRNYKRLPPFLEERIIASARMHRQRSGAWPHRDSGPIAGAPGETWMAVDRALTDGGRGLPGGSSLAQLLADWCGMRHPRRLAPLHADAIVAWARAHRQRMGTWPHQRDSGPIAGDPGETWTAIDNALRRGTRGLPGGSSLAQLLADRCGKRNLHALPPLQPALVLVWARAHCQRTGQWPTARSGPIWEVPGEAWPNVDAALRLGLRGLPGGSSLHQFLHARLGS